MLDAALHALTLILDPLRLGIMLGGVLLGLALGVVPGLGGIVGLALLIPFTYHLDGYTAFALLLGMAAVTTVSDFIPAVLFGVPGTVGAAATVLDGHPLAKQGHARRAFGAGYASSLAGGIFGALLLALAIPVLRLIVLYIGSAELLAMCIFGLSMVATLSGKAPMKGLAVASFGLMLSLIGSDPQTGTLRWTFGTLYLWDHLPIVPVTLGIFALPELADMAIERTGIARAQPQPGVRASTQWDGVMDAARHWWLILRCSGLGALLGAVPGIGSAVIDWMAYGHAIRTEKNAENFGKGDIRGVIASESSNNAKEGGHLIPTVAFGMPAGASMALLLSAFIMHGFTPGPEMLTKHLDVTYTIIWTLTISHIMGAVICLSSSSLFSRLATVRVGILIPLVVAIVYLGSFNASQSWGDLCSLVLFGAVGWIMKRLNWPRPPLILGLVLGSIFERYYFISHEIYGIGLFTRPVVIVILLAALWVVLGPTIKGLRKSWRTRSGAPSRAALAPSFKLRLRGFDWQIVFTLILTALVIVAMTVARDWAFAASLMPMTCAAAALVFCCIVLIEQLFMREAVSAEAKASPSFDTSAPMGELALAGAGAPFDAPQSQGDTAANAMAKTHAGPTASAAFGAHGDPSLHDGLASSLDTRTIYLRGVRFFGWIAGALGTAAVIGLLPGLLIFMLLVARFEFGERWRTSAVLSIAMTIALWLVFGRIFSTPWPQALIGDWWPALRQLGGLV
ncbi:membrane protein (plasmid) [Burkholderia sp. SFA1]|uniref:tripartite tricarboxylate transporter permease n=1 Tax=unclassified Caballeronia TaxID=2646786 RepID=UPI001F405E98|nr:MULTISPECIES: tripartite tricarboxylate transporter permease [unclassified Caballeronia]MCE4546688.1 tripartite tricarboxylate transporter permease [Caballeronia sp. PC1]MCE4572839.1 tripartite tricarboxylate transporter permease [Caballeronia sp. CLC5]BBQ01783.1 membrane protein [Burkholderia sp. SFA1]